MSVLVWCWPVYSRSVTGIMVWERLVDCECSIIAMRPKRGREVKFQRNNFGRNAEFVWIPLWTTESNQADHRFGSNSDQTRSQWISSGWTAAIAGKAHFARCDRAANLESNSNIYRTWITLTEGCCSLHRAGSPPVSSTFFAKESGLPYGLNLWFEGVWIVLVFWPNFVKSWILINIIWMAGDWGYTSEIRRGEMFSKGSGIQPPRPAISKRGKPSDMQICPGRAAGAFLENATTCHWIAIGNLEDSSPQASCHTK